MSNIVKQASTPNMLPHLNQAGRLSYEFGLNRKDTLAKIAGDIHKAALVMGIGVDGEKSALTASEALRKISEVYPHAWVQDISKAIEMGSFGQLKFADQLNTISALNIFQWYKELRIAHPDKIGEQHLKTYVEREMTNEEKFKLSVQGFKTFVTTQQKDELAQLVFFDRLVKMGVIRPTAEDKNSRTKAEIEKLIKNIPLEILQNSNERRAANAFKAYYNELEEPKKIAWNDWAENPLVADAIRRVKRTLVRECLEFYDPNELVELYIPNIANELQVEIPRSR
jgi:hypothetical protein